MKGEEFMKKTESIKLFYSGYDGSNNYRIPSLLTTTEGTVLAVADKRNQHSADYGDIDTIIRRKEKGEQEFSEGTVILNLADSHVGDNTSAFNIDPCLLQDKQTKRIFLLVDMFPESTGLFGRMELGSGYTKVDGKDYQLLYDEEGNSYTIREEGKVYSERGEDTGFCVKTVQSENGIQTPYKELGELYKGDVYYGNVYLMTGEQKGKLHIRCTNYLWLLYSDDDGKTWSAPRDITHMVKKDWMKFLGVGPGVGLQLKNGNLVFPVYHTNEDFGVSQCTAVLISEDHGETWKLGESPIVLMGDDPAVKKSGGQLTESQVIQIANGELKLFMRNTFENKVYVATSSNGGETWDRCEPIDIPEYYCQLSVFNYQKDEKEYVLLLNPSKDGRMDGKIYKGEISHDGTILWKAEKIMAEGHFQYSCITQNAEGNFEALYELDDENGIIALWHTEFTEDFISDER